MASCERITACPMFAVFSRKATLGVWRTLYCESNFEACERLKLFHAGQTAPVNMLPNGRMLSVPPSQDEGQP
jgi:hypothetical protein